MKMGIAMERSPSAPGKSACWQELTVQRWAAAVETYEALLMELQELHALAGPPAGVSWTPSTPVTGRRRERVSGTPGSPAVSQHSRPDPGSDDREKGVSRYSSHRLRGAQPGDNGRALASAFLALAHRCSCRRGQIFFCTIKKQVDIHVVRFCTLG